MADSVREPARDTPVLLECDVLVAGAGLAGIFAALAAARRGMRTVLVDRYGSLGGNYGPGLGARHDLWQSPRIHDRGLGGVVGEFLARLETEGGIRTFDFTSGGDRVNWRWDGMEPIPVIDNEGFQHLALRMMREEGVTLLLSTQVSGAIVAEQQIGGVFVETRTGRQAIRAAVVVDTSGEADVAAAAGAECDSSAANSNPGIGLFFKIGGVDWDQYEAFRAANRERPLGADEQRWVEEVLFAALGREWPNYPREILPAMRSAWDRGEFRYVGDAWGRGYLYMIPFGTHNREVTTVEARSYPGATEALRLDALDAVARSAVEAAARVYIHDVVAFHRRSVPGFEDAFVDQVAPYMGSRFSRTIVPEYTLTDEDLFTYRRFPDSIHVLNRLYKGPERQRLDFASREDGPRFEVPLRQLLPRGIDGLVAAGRCINRNQTASFRWRWVAKVMGAVAGVVAAESVRQGKTPKTLDVHALQRTLVEDGYFLGEEDRLAELGLQAAPA